MTDKIFYQVIEKTLSGERLSPEDCLVLFESNDLVALGAAADQMRNSFHPEGIATYCVDRNINYTNVCDVYCTFCAFYRPPGGHPQSYVRTKEEIKEIKNNPYQLLMISPTYQLLDVPASVVISQVPNVPTRVPKQEGPL